MYLGKEVKKIVWSTEKIKYEGISEKEKWWTAAELAGDYFTNFYEILERVFEEQEAIGQPGGTVMAHQIIQTPMKHRRHIEFLAYLSRILELYEYISTSYVCINVYNVFWPKKAKKKGQKIEADWVNTAWWPFFDIYNLYFIQQTCRHVFVNIL